jgi:hypothetical protein
LIPTKSKDSGDDVLAGSLEALPDPLKHADSPPRPTNDESPTEDESAKAEFMREISKGPENVAAISAMLRHRKLKKHFIFVCRCPFCVRVGLRHAFTTRLSNSLFRQWDPSLGIGVIDRVEHVILDEFGFISYDHLLGFWCKPLNQSRDWFSGLHQKPNKNST